MKRASKCSKANRIKLTLRRSKMINKIYTIWSLMNLISRLGKKDLQNRLEIYPMFRTKMRKRKVN